MEKRKDKRKHISLPTSVIIILLTALVFMLFVISYMDYCSGYEWWSSVLSGLSASLITGLIIYTLTNYRSAKYKIAQNEYFQIKSLYDCIVNFKRDVSFFKKHHIVYDDHSINTFVDNISNSIDVIDELIELLPERVFYVELKYDDNYPVTNQMKENIRKAYLNISDEEDWEHIEKLCELLICSYDSLVDWIKPTYQLLNQRFVLYQTKYY